MNLFLLNSVNNNRYECYINRPYLKEDHLNSFTQRISSLRVFKCESCPAGYYQDQNYQE